MKTRLIQIGKSRGVRIPNAVLQRAGLTEELEMDVRGDGLLLRSANGPREGWEDKFREMAARGDDKLLDPEIPTTWDLTEWQW